MGEEWGGKDDLRDGERRGDWRSWWGGREREEPGIRRNCWVGGGEELGGRRRRWERECERGLSPSLVSTSLS